ncbi:MAG: SGNH/GDSL hydrolase family protein [Pseudomonadota bacterium]
MWKSLGLVVASVLFSLAVAEAGFRLAGYNYPLVTRYDPWTGFTNGADMDGLVDTESVERLTLDRFGLRTRDGSAPERTLAKPAGVFRIAVLGDSYTEAFHVAYDEAFPTVIERELNRCPAIGRPVEVLDFGVSGYSNVQELERWRHVARAFDPDLVLLVVHAANDLHNNFRKHEQNPFIPYGELRDGRLVIDRSFRDDPAFRAKLRWSNLRNDLANHSWAIRFAISTIGRARLQAWHRGRTEQLAAVEPAAVLPSPPPPAAGPKTDGWPPRPQPDDAEMAAMFDPGSPTPPPYEDPEANPPRTAAEETLWRLAEAVIAELAQEVEASGARLWLTTTATRLAIDPDPRKREAWTARTGWPAPEYARHRLGGFAAAHGIPYVSVNDELRAYAERTGKNLEFFDKKQVAHGHWNRDGHRIAGETVARAVCASAGP